jgi:large subunit ribosomal protein L29
MKKSQTLREIREGSEDELKARVARLEEELFGLRMKRFTNQLENTAKIRTTRREIALVKTVLAGRATGTEKRQAATEKPAAQE